MPLYEYECGNCGQRFEVIQKFSDAPITVCQKCGGGPVEKLLSSPAIQFKGSGFYLTDYGRGTGSKSDTANAKAGKSDKADKAAKTDGGSGAGDTAAKSDSGSSSESKPAASETPAAKSAPAKAD